MGAIKELMSSYKDAHGCYPENNDELWEWNRQRDLDRASAEQHESMEGGERPTTALVVAASAAVALATLAIAMI